MSRWYNVITLALISLWTGTCHASVWLFWVALFCNWTCWTTSRMPWRRWTETKGLCMSPGVQYHPVKEWILGSHWGKSFDFITPADSVRRLEMQNFGFTSFVPVLMSLAAEAETLFTMGKRVERVPTLWLQTTPQETANNNCCFAGFRKMAWERRVTSSQLLPRTKLKTGPAQGSHPCM